MATEPISSGAVAAPDETLPVTTEVPPPAPAENSGFLKRNSLRFAGLLNLVGDIAMLVDGIFGKNEKGVRTPDKYKIFGGGFYTLGGLNLALFGRVKPEDKVKQTTKDTAEFIQEKTGHAVEAASLTPTQPDNASRGFFYRNAAQNTLYAYTLGAVAMLFSGIKNYRADKEKWGGLAYGILSVLFKVTSLLVPEKSAKEKQEEKKKGGFIEWIREKPLRIFGYGSMLTDTAYGIQTYQKYKKDPTGKGYGWDATTTITYLLSDFLMANSNKNPENAGGKLAPMEQQRVEDVAAAAIAREPQEKREGLVREVAQFLAARPETMGKATDIKKSLEQRIAKMGEDSWTSRLKTGLALQAVR